MNLSDREFQREILRFVKESYPHPAFADALNQRFGGSELSAHLHYLDNHGLIEMNASRLCGPEPMERLVSATITAKGIDYLEADGGLGAELGIVTVRLDTNQLREMLDKRIAESPGPESVKDRLRAKVLQMPEEALGQLSHRLFEILLGKAPDLIAHLRLLIS
ncbi:hypothetical protein [Marinobacter shengliensis]|uniref:hypothetical protein n=1 Tax=Marinobacter shengliensis TaxID=1389223 RepID=UPI002572E659|nr:hypothetical protein [Marinobacter shengliensis]BEH14275.1 hypothetical protein MAALD49_16430 [Marinobacter shengliensis]